MPAKIITATEAVELTGFAKDVISKAVKRGDIKRVWLPGENKRISRNCYLLERDVKAWARAQSEKKRIKSGAVTA